MPTRSKCDQEDFQLLEQFLNCLFKGEKKKYFCLLCKVSKSKHAKISFLILVFLGIIYQNHLYNHSDN